MRLKLIIAFVQPDRTEQLLAEARKVGASGATVLNNARGEGRNVVKGILGLEIAAQRDVIFMLVEQRCAQAVLQRLAEVGKFDDSPGTGIVLKLDVEEALGIREQMSELIERLDASPNGKAR
jgi:nitrogen regulatory protein PII